MSEDFRMWKTEYAIRIDKNPSLMNRRYAMKRYDKKYAILAYWGAVKKIFLERHKDKRLKPKEFECIFWLHSRPQGFTTADFKEYPHGYKMVASNKFLARLIEWGWVELRHGRCGGERPSPNVYATTHSFAIIMKEYYEWLYKMKPIPINKKVLGDLYEDKDFVNFLHMQRRDVEAEKKEYSVYTPKER